MLATIDKNQVYHSVSYAAAVRHQSQCNIIVTLCTWSDVQVQYTVKREIFDHQFLDHHILDAFNFGLLSNRRKFNDSENIYNHNF